MRRRMRCRVCVLEDEPSEGRRMVSAHCFNSLFLVWGGRVFFGPVFYWGSGRIILYVMGVTHRGG